MHAKWQRAREARNARKANDVETKDRRHFRFIVARLTKIAVETLDPARALSQRLFETSLFVVVRIQFLFDYRLSYVDELSGVFMRWVDIPKYSYVFWLVEKTTHCWDIQQRATPTMPPSPNWDRGCPFATAPPTVAVIRDTGYAG
jgi:hypothetical protein